MSSSNTSGRTHWIWLAIQWPFWNQDYRYHGGQIAYVICRIYFHTFFRNDFCLILGTRMGRKEWWVTCFYFWFTLGWSYKAYSLWCSPLHWLSIQSCLQLWLLTYWCVVIYPCWSNKTGISLGIILCLVQKTNQYGSSHLSLFFTLLLSLFPQSWMWLFDSKSCSPSLSLSHSVSQGHFSSMAAHISVFFDY